MRLTFVLLLGACATVDPVAGPPPGATGENRPSASFGTNWETPGASETLKGLADHVEALPDETRAALAEAAQELAVNCIYNRTSFMVPLAVQGELAQIDLAAVRPTERAALIELQAGISQHVRLIRALEADRLPLPASTDYLAGVTYGLVDGSAFEALSDPIEVSHHHVRLIPDLVSSMPPQTIDRLDAARAILQVELGDQVLRSQAFREWAERASELAAAMEAGPAKEHAQRVADLLSALQNESC